MDSQVNPPKPKFSFPPKPSKKYNMFNYLYNLKSLTKPDPTYTPHPELASKSLSLQYFLSQGLIINKVTFARFFLKNGLPYDGLVALEPLAPSEIIIKVPKNLILDTKNAYKSEIFNIFQENKEFFWDDNDIDEGLVLTVYILYEYQKGEKSELYHLIKNLPRDLDIMQFWGLEDIDNFSSVPLKNYAIRQNLMIKKEYNDLSLLLDRYPQYISKETYTYDNFCWIYCNLSNRSFDKSECSFVRLIPFADNINHEVTETFFRDSMSDCKNIIYKGSSNEGDSEDSSSTSETSSLERESLYDEEFYDNDDIVVVNEINTEKDYVEEIHQWLDENMDYRDLFAFIYACKVIEYIDSLKGLLNEKELKEKLIEIHKMNIDYKKLVEGFYTDDLCYVSYKRACNFMASAYKNKNDIKNEQMKKKPNIIIHKDAFNLRTLRRKFKKDKFDYVEFVVSPTENYEKNAQIYFPYYNNSNKKLIKNYGFCLEYNIYDNAYVQLEYQLYLPFKIINSPVFTKKARKIQKYQKFKLKYDRFNEELICFFKLLAFDFKTNKSVNSIFKPNDLILELKAVNNVIGFLQQSSISKYTMQENEEKLYDKSLNYHQYFACVYRLEQQRIIALQRKLMEIYRNILEKLQKGVEVIESMKMMENENEEEYNRNIYLMYYYLIKIAF